MVAHKRLSFSNLLAFLDLKPHTPVAQKVANEVFFRRFQGEEVELILNRPSLIHPQIFDAHLLENTNLNSFSFHFSVVYNIKICFESDGFIAYPNAFDINRYLFFAAR